MTAFINEAHFKDSARLIRVLQSHRPEKAGGCYLVKGTCDQLDDLAVQLSAALNRESGPDSGPSDHQQKEDSSLDVSSVCVSASVMNYIQLKCSEDLNRIAGSHFLIETQTDERTVSRGGTRMLLVTFRPRNPSECRLHADFVRQRFIVFYQKTASNLTVVHLPLSLSNTQDLQRSFPQLLFENSGDRPELTVTGTFAHVAAVEKFSFQKLLSSPERTAFSPPSANRRERGEQSCPICLENTDATKRRTLECKHSFCTECLKQAFKHKPVCPTCGKVYGVVRGTQPEGGEMQVFRSRSPLPGYEQHGTIIIDYSIPSGVQQVRAQSRGRKLRFSCP